MRTVRVLLVLVLVAGVLLGRPAAADSATPVIATKVIGRSVQGRPITAYELGDPRAPLRAVVLGSMHGYWEQAGEQVTRSIRSGGVAIPAGLDLWVVDTINPDGDALHQRGNAHGVDLNRNWPSGWVPIGTSGGAFDSHYSGPAALSEPETRALSAFLQQVRPARLVSMHQPLDAVDTTQGGARDVPFRDALAHALGLREAALTCGSACHGTMTGWLTANTATAAVTVEFPGAQSAAAPPGTGPTPAYLSGQAARGIVAALMTGVRATPTTAQARAYVTLLYARILSRSPDAGGLAAYAGALTSGRATALQVAQAISGSGERRNLLTQYGYEVCTGAAASPPIVAATSSGFWPSHWAGLLGSLCGSATALARAGGDRRGWADRIYLALLGRHASPGEQAYQAARAQRDGLVATATAVAGSVESERHWVDTVFVAMLGRPATGAELATFAPAMPADGELTVPATVAATPAFFRL